MTSENNLCPTILLEDSPANEDAFGPHARVANAIVDLITSSEEKGGKAIGLEGGWGSGKSTVVKLVREKLSSQHDFRVVSFDAWAHEGDPLRRSYLETIIRSLQLDNWIEIPKWNKTLDSLAHRRKETTTRITPKPTPLGVVFAISLLLVPLGATLLSAVFRSGVEQAFTSPKPAAFIGGLLALAPFIVLACNLLRLILKTLWKLLPWKNNDSQKPAHSEWAFLFSKAIHETHTDSIESADPTSLEFEKYFTSAMREALGDHKNRRILLVVDNLDRVEPDDATAIWSTLQTFLQERTHEKESWFDQIWILVPYDPSGLRKLWDSRTGRASLEENHTKTRGAADGEDCSITESFLDKSFQIRFRVPPPVLSDWKAFLASLVDIALPGHAEDRHMLYRVYEHERNKHGLPPTPREIKLFVNQIGAVHRQWQHEFPLSHVAFYVLQNRKRIPIIQRLRSNDFPSADAVRLLGKNLSSSLAGLSFNTTANKGMELLLSDQVYECLVNGRVTDLQQLEERHNDGFWAILESVVSSRLYDSEAAAIASAASCLRGADMLAEDSRPERQSVRKALESAAEAIEKWTPFDSQMASGIAALCETHNSEDFSKTMGLAVQRTVEAVDKEDETRGHDLVAGLFTVFDSMTGLGHEAAIPSKTTIPVDVAGWIAACTEADTYSSTRAHWKRIRPKIKFEALSTAMQESVSAGEFDQDHVSTIRVSHMSPMKTDWSAVASAIDARLRAEIGAEHDESFFLLDGLWELRRCGDASATKTTKVLVEGGHVMHHMQQAGASGQADGKAMCILTHIELMPELAVPPAVGNSAAGHQHCLEALASTDVEVATSLIELLDTHDEIDRLFTFADSRGKCDPLLAASFKLVANSDKPQRLFSTPVVLERWQDIRDSLTTDDDDKAFKSLLERLAADYGLCKSIIEDGEGFQPGKAELYWQIATSAKSNVSDFLQWCKAGVEGMVRHAWLSDLQATCECVWLALTLADKGVVPVLTTPLADALCDHAESLAQGQHVPEEAVIERWEDVLSLLLDKSVRVSLRPRLLAIAVSSDENIHGAFFEMYGGELGDQDVLSANQDVVSGLFSPLVRVRSLEGLRWLQGVLDKNSTLIDPESSDDKTHEFVTRLRDCITNPQEDEAQQSISHIASTLGIEIEDEGEVEDEPSDEGT